MPRTAINLRDASSTTSGKTEKADSYTEQIIKYIPAEVVAFYLPALAIASEFKEQATTTEQAAQLQTQWPPSAYAVTIWLLFILSFIGTIVYMFKTASNDLESQNLTYVGQRAAVKTVLATVAFFVWAVFLGPPLDFIPKYQTVGTLLIFVFTFLNPMLYQWVSFPLSLTHRSLSIEITHIPTVDNKPGKVTSVTIANNSRKEIVLQSLKLCCRGKKKETPDIEDISMLSIDQTIEANKSVTIDTPTFVFNENATKYAVEVETRGDSNSEESKSFLTQMD